MISKAQEKKIKAYAKTPKEHLATIYTRNVRATGLHYFLPLLGWIEPRAATPVLILSGTLLRIADQSYGGSGTWCLPCTPENREAIVALLAALGWSGAIWPRDKGWPTGAAEENGLTRILNGVPVSQTFSFVPDADKGSRVKRVIITKTSGFAPLSPEIEEIDAPPPTEAMRAEYDALLASPMVFMPEGWPEGKKRNLEGLDFAPLAQPGSHLVEVAPGHVPVVRSQDHLSDTTGDHGDQNEPSRELERPEEQGGAHRADRDRALHPVGPIGIHPTNGDGHELGHEGRSAPYLDHVGLLDVFLVLVIHRPGGPIPLPRPLCGSSAAKAAAPCPRLPYKVLLMRA